MMDRRASLFPVADGGKSQSFTREIPNLAVKFWSQFHSKTGSTKHTNEVTFRFEKKIVCR